MDIIHDSSSRCWILQMEDSTYCFKLSEDASTLQHIYWGSRVSRAQAIEMSYAIAPLRLAFESPKGISREEYAPWGEMRFTEPSLKVTYADGTRVIEWIFEAQGIEHIPSR